jgi:hypothetical protein
MTDTRAGIIQKFKEKPINLEALFTGGNPFDEPSQSRIPAMQRSILTTFRSNLPLLFF